MYLQSAQYHVKCTSKPATALFLCTAVRKGRAVSVYREWCFVFWVFCVLLNGFGVQYIGWKYWMLCQHSSAVALTQMAGIECFCLLFCTQLKIEILFKLHLSLPTSILFLFDWTVYKFLFLFIWYAIVLSTLPYFPPSVFTFFSSI